MTRVTIAATAALMLAACGGQGEGEADQAGNQAEAASGTEGAAPGGAALAMNPGDWEMTVQMVRMNAPGIPAGATPPTPATTVRTCLTPDEASQPTPGFLTGGGQADANSNCTYENFSNAGGRIQGTVQCTMPEGTMRMTLDGTVTATSYELTQQTQMSGGGTNGMEMESRITGRRIGDCPAG